MVSAHSYTVILDRDKTINDDPGYLNDPAKVALLPRAAEGIRLLNQFGIRVFVASNQAGVAKGLITPEQLAAVNERIVELLAKEGARVEKIYVCIHGDADNCDCRKPKPGLIRQIIAEQKIDPLKTFVAGDRARDLECAIDFKIRGILVGDDEKHEPANMVLRAANLFEVASYVLEAVFEEESHRKVHASATAFAPELEKTRASGKKVVFTNGCFDLVHSGHVQLLAQARALGDYLVLGLNSDRSVKALKGPSRPVNNETDRARILAQLPYIDAVVIFDEDTPIELMKKIQPDIQVKGGDYIKEKLPEYAVMRELGKEIVILPFRKGYSTTGILARSGSK
ncbi:MAG: D-glycero-beta-D-manno-heptose 1-phosphate adenylyltransferase [Spirochaetes bacterium]|nr:D-glycero-beta-D-manno-heptose 1-phosphate adenylyltransferase [Spirochaetota bacterium]